MVRKEDVKVVILCGGMGTRLREQTEFMPKPLVKIGDMPILWHIMKTYSYYGYNNFVLCLGYKGEMIKEFFINFEWMANDITLNLKSGREFVAHHEHLPEEWNITFANTGLETLTGFRIKKIQKYIKEDFFLATYGDGVADANISGSVDFHLKKNKIATLTAIHPISRFGVIESDGDMVKGFHEKPVMEGLINGGFFVFRNEIFDHIEGDTMLEDTTPPKLSKLGQLAVYRHNGFWHCMDTYRDYEFLNKLWNSNQAKWKVWD